MPSGKLELRWLRRALHSLDAEAQYIAEFDRVASVKMVSRVHEAVEKLRDYPAMGRPGRVPETRELVVTGTPYIIPYRLRGRHIDILRVFHARRRWPQDI